MPAGGVLVGRSSMSTCSTVSSLSPYSFTFDSVRRLALLLYESRLLSFWPVRTGGMPQEVCPQAGEATAKQRNAMHGANLSPPPRLAEKQACDVDIRSLLKLRNQGPVTAFRFNITSSAGTQGNFR